MGRIKDLSSALPSENDAFAFDGANGTKKLSYSELKQKLVTDGFINELPDIGLEFRFGSVAVTRQAGDNSQNVTFSTPFTSGDVFVIFTLPTTVPNRYMSSATGASLTGFTAHVYNTGESESGTATAWYLAVNKPS